MDEIKGLIAIEFTNVANGKKVILEMPAPVYQGVIRINFDAISRSIF